MSKRDQRRAENESVLRFYEARAAEMGEALRAQKARRLATSVAKEQLFFNQLMVAQARLLDTQVVPSKYAVQSAKKKQKVDRILNVKLSDLHFGARLDGRELPIHYGPTEEARRLAHVARQAIEYKYVHRNETSCKVHILGDTFQGQLHDPRDGAPLAEQVASTQYLLTQFVARMSEHFHKVDVYCTPGNHGRFKTRHPERATNEKWDALETVMYYGVKQAVQCLPNVSVTIPRTPWYAWEAFGQWGFGTHGDTVFKGVGYPGSNLNVKAAKAEVNKINTSRTYGGRRYSLFMMGHVHVGSMTQLDNGAVLLTNGPLIPPDGFSVSLGSLDNECCQWMFESTKDHILGDARLVKLTQAVDNDKSLDSLISAFSDF